MCLALSQENWINIGHLNVHSYNAKVDDVTSDQCVLSTDVMCFTETFLTPQLSVGNIVLNKQPAQVYRLDRPATYPQDLEKGGIMVACVESLQPEEVNIHHHGHLEVKTISLTHHSIGKMYIVTMYRRPWLPAVIFLGHLDNYLSLFPYKQYPTVILGDFNDNLSGASSSVMTPFLSARGFAQLVKTPTTHSCSLLDHIYYNGPEANTVVDVVDTYYSDHNATFVSICA